MNESLRESDPATLEKWQTNAERHKREAHAAAERMLNRLRARVGNKPVSAAMRALVANDGHPHCDTCGSARQVLGAEGKLKPCPTCGHIWRQAHAATVAKYCSNTGKARFQEFGNFNPRKGDVAKALVWTETFCKRLVTSELKLQWLVLCGKRGVGKSHLLGAAFNYAQRNNIAPIFVTMPDLLQSLKATFGDEGVDAEGETSSMRLQKYQEAELLILDDLGAESETDWSRGILFELVDYRYRNQLPTIFASNYDMRMTDNEGKPNTHFDARCMSRWNDKALAAILIINDTDFRLEVPE